MPRANADLLDAAIRRNRSLLRAEIPRAPLTQPTPSALSGEISIARVSSIDSQSRGFVVGGATLVVIDEVQARWILALCQTRPSGRGNIWPIFVLFHYLVLRLLASGLPKEACLLGDRLRAETRLLDRDLAIEVGSATEAARGIEAFILGHELGHVAYKAGGTEIQALLEAVHSCTDDLTRLLKVTFSGDRSLLTEAEQDPRYEDITLSITDYINRFVFHERTEDIPAIERDLLERADTRALYARLNRLGAFAEVFEQIDFREEAFCDLYALEFRLSDAGGDRERAEAIARQWWVNLHAMFAMAAMDSLTRDRRVAAQVHVSKRELLWGVVFEALSEGEKGALSMKLAEIDATREGDRKRLFYQVAMIKVVYRRVALMNYMERHPLLDRAEFLQGLKEDGERLENQFLGAAATLRFNLLHLEETHATGFGDTLDGADDDALRRLWADIAVRVPAMDQASATHQDDEVSGTPFRARYACAFCGFDVAETRLVVTTGRVSICDQCVLVAGHAFAAMPQDHPRRPTVKWALMAPPPPKPPDRADPATPHCHFCEMTAAPGEPLVSSPGGIPVCAYCAEAALAIVRSKSPASDPSYVGERQQAHERYSKLTQDSTTPLVTELMSQSAQAALDDIERALNPRLPGVEIWRLFTEPTAQPWLPAG